MKKLISVIFGFLLIISIVSAQLGIYFSVGEPKLLETTHFSRDNINFLQVKFTNEGSDVGTFRIRTSCNSALEVNYNNFNLRTIQLESFEIRELEIPLVCYGDDCFSSIVTCDIILEDVNAFNRDSGFVMFEAQRPNYCDTPFRACNPNEVQCLNNNLMRCNSYCDKFILLEICENRCGYFEGNHVCISSELEEAIEKGKKKERFWDILFAIFIWIIFIVSVIIVIFFIIKVFDEFVKKRIKKESEVIISDKISAKSNINGSDISVTSSNANESYCVSCGNKLSGSENFCSRCGKQIT